MSFVELVRRKVEKMARGPCLLCFHEAGVALSHLMVSKKRLDTILAFSNSYGNICTFLYPFTGSSILSMDFSKEVRYTEVVLVRAYTLQSLVGNSGNVKFRAGHEQIDNYK